MYYCCNVGFNTGFTIFLTNTWYISSEIKRKVYRFYYTNIYSNAWKCLKSLFDGGLAVVIRK